MNFSGDVDIDTRTDFDPSTLFPWVKASMIRDGELVKHPVGVYPQNIPRDPLTNLAAIPYKDAESLGYSKIDFLHLNIYNFFNSREEIEQLLEIEPDWGLLLIPSEQQKLFQLANHGDVLSDLKPRSIEDLADALALIRPGKKQLISLYKVNKEATRKILYLKDDDGYSFKKSHAISYALVIQLQLHLIATGLI